ncbi:MAG: RloB family protein [Anaerolineaceae bacterium]
MSKSHLSPQKSAYKHRPHDQIKTRQRFLIVCEGQETEKNYFERFHAPNKYVKVVGKGKTTENLIIEALKLRNDGEYDQVWLVFDKDDISVETFEKTIVGAEKKGLKVAYSNQAFELWFVLHFEYLHSAIDRKAYLEKLNNCLGFKYEKTDADMYDHLKCRIDTALRNAARLREEYNPPRPGKDDPSTTVDLLVKALQVEAEPLTNKRRGSKN